MGAEASLTGRLLDGRYLVGALAGEGGMGAVYRGTDTTNGAAIALKVILGAHVASLERFAREIEVLASLNHPGIVRYVGHGRADDDTPFLAMEWMDGEDLAARLARGPIRVEEAIALMSRAARALAEIHARGIVHRDIKPSNVFLRGGALDQPVLLDFGIARLADASTALTRTGSILGSPQYMSPEQVRGERGVGAPSDLFSLGSVFFECLAGRPAFVAEHAMAVLAKILLEESPPIRTIAPHAPAKIEALLSSMLAKRPEDRPANALAIAERLEHVGAMSTDATLSASATTLGSRERRLVSVVLARDPAVDVDRTVDAELAAEENRALAGEIEALGGTLTPIGASNLVVTIASNAATVDQAASAARCARVIERARPSATVAVAMGWAELDPLPVGEVIDRAAGLLERGPGAIHVDEVSAGLLELRFDVGGEAGRRVLGHERSSAEPPRTLLGRPTPCVGRDRELSVLLGLLGEVTSDGVARVAHVTAPAGVGKSRLRHELFGRIASAHPDALILLARADALREKASLDALGQLVRDAAGVRVGDDPAVACERIAARAACVAREKRDPADVAAFLGEIASVPFADSASPRLAQARRDNRVIGELMLEAWLAWLGAELGQRPVVLVIEDLHWADAQSVRYLDAALRELSAKPLFVLALSRPEVHGRFPNLWKDRAVQEIALPPLTARAAERLVRAALNDLPADDVERVVRQAEGNPLYLEEIIRAAASGVVRASPVSVIAMMQSRLESLDAGVRRIVRTASVFGESFEIEDVIALIGSEDDVRAATTTLLEREVVTRRGGVDGGLAFRHALLREAAYAMFTPDDRARAHAQAAERIAARGGADPIVVAEHWDLARDEAAAAPWYARAAREALRKNDFEQAIARADIALARSSDPAIRVLALGARGKARGCLGRWADAERDLEEALTLTMPPAQRMEILEDLCIASSYRQDGALMRKAALDALGVARAEGRDDLANEARMALAIADHLDGDCVSALAQFRGAVGGMRAQPGPILGIASIIHYHAATYGEGEAVVRRTIALARDVGDTLMQVTVTGTLGLLLAAQGRYGEAQGTYDDARTLATKYGMKALIARTVSMTVGYPFDGYDLDEAERRATETLQLGRALEFVTPRVNASLDLAYVAVRRGQPELAERHVAEVAQAIAGGPGFHGWIWRSRFAVLHAEILAARGRWSEALALAASCADGCRALGRVKYRILAEHVVARALAALGRRDEAVAAARRTLDDARAYPDPAMLVRAAAVLLELTTDERARGDLADAAARMERELPDARLKQAFRANAPLAKV